MAAPQPRREKSPRFRLYRVRSPLLSVSRLISFPTGTKMFQFPAFASTPYVFRCQYPKGVGFPIRTSRDQSSLAAPPGLSQPNTSFIASMRQGIHQTPLAYFQPNPRMRIKVVCLVSHSPRPEGPWLTASRPTRSRGLISVIGNHL